MFPLCLTIFLTTLLALTRPVAAQEEPAPLIVGFLPVLPFGHRDEDGTRTGFFVDLAEAIAADIGVPVRWIEVDSSRALVRAQAAGETQMIAGIARLPALNGSSLFSASIATETLRLTVLVERAATIAAAPLEGLRIGVVPPAAGSDRTGFLAANLPVEFDAPEIALLALISGDVDALLIPEPVVFSMAKRARLDARVACVDPPITTFDRFVALHESRADLMPGLEAALARMAEDGRLAALRRKHFIVTPPPAPDVLTVGVSHFPPYQIVHDDGTFSGIGVDTLRDLAAAANLELRFSAVSLEDWHRGPGPETYDMLPPLGISPERLSRMDFTLAIESSPLSIFTRIGDAGTIRGLDDLTGLRVGVQTANISYPFVRDRTDLTLVPAATPADLFADLLEGRTDALVYTSQRVRDAAIEGGFESRIAEITPPFHVTQRAPALRFGLADVREQLNAEIPDYLISAQYAALRDRYFGVPVFWTSPRLIALGATGGLLFLALIGTSVAVQLRAQTAARIAAERSAQAASTAAIRDELETVLNAATSGIVALDGAGRIQRINNRARHMLGGISDDTPFDWPSEIRFLDGETLAPLDASADPVRRILSGHTLRGETHLLRRTQPGDNRRYVRVESAQLDHPEQGLSAVLVIDDVSNEERNRQVVERKSRLDALGQLTGGIAHDFNNLLASLLYAVELAKTAADDDKRSRFLNVAITSVTRGRDLTYRLLSFAKRQPGLARSKPVGAVFRDFEQLISPLIEAKVAISFHWDDPDLQVFCDQTQLETALMNLVLNSRDAIFRSGQGDRIDVRARPVRSTRKELDAKQDSGEGTHGDPIPDGSSYRYVEISVTDNGPGMDEETLARSTDPFFTTKDSSSGTGLGLSMVYGFTRQSDGDLILYSEEGVGTTIQIILPRGTTLGAREAPVEDEAPTRGDGETILVVEDEFDLLIMIKNIVEDLGYVVLTAQSGEAALEVLASGRHIDLLLTDVVMPGKVGGFELARRVREMSASIPVIYTSGYTGFTSSEMGEVQAPLLQKPAPPAEIARLISTALRPR